jgi:hypothetical protein
MLPELKDALQSSAYTPHQKLMWEWAFSSGLLAALQAGSGITITQDADAGTFTFATTIPTSVGKHAVPINAAALHPRQTNGCASLAYLSGASDQPDVPYLAFDASSAEYAGIVIPAPKSWNESTVTFAVHWAHPATVTNFGVTWKLRAVAVSNDDATAVNFGSAVAVSDTGGTTSDVYRSDESAAVTIGGTPAEHDLLFLEIYRDPADGSDTMTVDAYLLGVTVFFTTNAATDA